MKIINATTSSDFTKEWRWMQKDGEVLIKNRAKSYQLFRTSTGQLIEKVQTRQGFVQRNVMGDGRVCDKKGTAEETS